MRAVTNALYLGSCVHFLAVKIHKYFAVKEVGPLTTRVGHMLN